MASPPLGHSTLQTDGISIDQTCTSWYIWSSFKRRSTYTPSVFISELVTWPHLIGNYSKALGITASSTRNERRIRYWCITNVYYTLSDEMVNVSKTKLSTLCTELKPLFINLKDVLLRDYWFHIHLTSNLIDSGYGSSLILLIPSVYVDIFFPLNTSLSSQKNSKYLLLE